jgi:hypothetical protein
VLDRDPVRNLLGVQKTVGKLFEHFRQSLIEVEVCPQLFQLVIRGPVHPELVEQHFHIREFVVVTVFTDQLRATPEFRPVNSERGEHYFVLHVARAQRLIVVVNNRDGVLRRGHGVTLKRHIVGSFFQAWPSVSPTPLETACPQAVGKSRREVAPAPSANPREKILE